MRTLIFDAIEILIEPIAERQRVGITREKGLKTNCLLDNHTYPTGPEETHQSLTIRTGRSATHLPEKSTGRQLNSCHNTRAQPGRIRSCILLECRKWTIAKWRWERSIQNNRRSIRIVEREERRRIEREKEGEREAIWSRSRNPSDQ